MSLPIRASNELNEEAEKGKLNEKWFPLYYIIWLLLLSLSYSRVARHLQHVRSWESNDVISAAN